AGGAKRLSPLVALLGRETGGGGDPAARHPPYRRHARHPRLSVDERGAAAALALRAAGVLWGAVAEAVAGGSEKRDCLLSDARRSSTPPAWGPRAWFATARPWARSRPRSSTTRASRPGRSSWPPPASPSPGSASPKRTARASGASPASKS